MTQAPTVRSRLDSLRYLIFGRVCPGAVFGLLAWFALSSALSSLRKAISHPSLSALFLDSPYPVFRCVYCAFFLFIALIYVGRPMPLARAGGLLPRVFGFAGTTMLGVLPSIFDSGQLIVRVPTPVHDLASVLLLVSAGFAVYGLVYLRMNFSVIPEARHLVREGPYRLVRHPLYLAEVGTAISITLQGDLRFWTTVQLVPFVAVQFGRTVFEERLLSDAFPEYHDYASHTRRLVPFLW